MQIKYVDWGMAGVQNNVVYMNKNLNKPEYAELKAWILKHELAHEPGSFTWEDFKHDVVDTLMKPQDVAKSYFRFFWRHPSAWVQVLPVWVYDGVLSLDLSRLWAWVFYTGIIGIILWVVF